MRSRMYLSPPDVAPGEGIDPDARILTRKKANFAPRDESINLRWDYGVRISVDAPGNIDRIAIAANADRVFKTLLRETYKNQAWGSPNQFARNYAPATFAKMSNREGL